MHDLLNKKMLLSNEGVNSAYNYTSAEIDLLLAVLVQASRTAQNENFVNLSYGQLQTNFDLDYKETRAAFRGLLGKPLEVFFSETGTYYIANVISGVTIQKNTGHIHVELNAKMKALLLDVKRTYTGFEIKSVLSLKSKYAKRIYLLISQFKNTGIRYMSVEDLKKKLGVADKYEKISDLKKRILEPAIQEISALTEFQCEYEFTRTSKKFDEITFIFKLHQEAAQLAGNEMQIKFMRGIGLSEWQIENTYQIMTAQELHPILYQFNLAKDKIKNKPAYLVKVLNEHGVPMKQKISKQYTIC